MHLRKEEVLQSLSFDTRDPVRNPVWLLPTQKYSFIKVKGHRRTRWTPFTFLIVVFTSSAHHHNTEQNCIVLSKKDQSTVCSTSQKAAGNVLWIDEPKIELLTELTIVIFGGRKHGVPAQ